MQLLGWIFLPSSIVCCDFPRMATSLTLIATIKLANRNANNKWYGPQHARKISEKGTEDKDWASRWKSVVEGKRATRLSVSVGFHGEDMRKRWSCLIPVFIGPAHEGKPLLHTGWVSSHGEKKGCAHKQTGTVYKTYYKTGWAATLRLYILQFSSLFTATSKGI